MIAHEFNCDCVARVEECALNMSDSSTLECTIITLEDSLMQQLTLRLTTASSRETILQLFISAGRYAQHLGVALFLPPSPGLLLPRPQDGEEEAGEHVQAHRDVGDQVPAVGSWFERGPNRCAVS